MSASIVQAQQAYKAQQAQGRTTEATDAARAADKASHKELNAMRALPCNAECFDCSAKKPGWAALPHGVFVCIDCAQIHRNMGRHISQTKAVNTGTYLWFPHELNVMREVGNGVAARMYAAAPPKPDRDALQADKEAYCRAKYIDCRWGPCYDAVAPPQKPTTNTSVPLAAKPLQPVAAAAVQTAKRPAATRKGGLAAAIKVASNEIDRAPLIDFGVAQPPQHSQCFTPEQPTWTAFAEDDWRTTPATMPATAPALQPAIDEYADKKAAVLSLYGAKPARPGMPSMPATPAAFQSVVQPRPASVDCFFAQYGL